MSRSGLLQWIERLDRARILVLGDIMLDRFIYGDVSRISPEGPVPVLKSTTIKSVLGGAGNVVRNLAALGARTRLISLIGPDREGEQIKSLVSDLSATESMLIVDDKRQSTVKTRFMSKQQQLLRVDSETPHAISEEIAAKAAEYVRRSVQECDVCIVSDYGKGFLSSRLLKETVALCSEQGTRVLVDPKGLDYAIYQGSTILTPNLKELGEATRMRVDDDSAVIEAARKLIDACNLEAVLATRSQEGMSLVERSGKTTHFRSEAREVFDVTGAGDTVIAVLAASLSAGAPLAESAEIANIAAGIVVGKAGTAVTYVKDILHIIRRQELSTAESKVCDLEAAIDRADVWRRKGYKIGFLSGFFELLHPAHIKLISQAAKACDRLIVGINSDSSIYRLKDENPILHEAARSSIIASLEDVDMVVVFHDDTPARLIEALNPDVYIKRASDSGEMASSAVGQNGGKSLLLVNISKDAKSEIKDSALIS